MIRDAAFKKLLHQHRGFSKHLNGQELESGYKPDFVLRKGSQYIILESENCSSRKTFVGGMLKAAHFLKGERHGQLVFVIVPKENTTAAAIARHLKPYFKFIQPLTNLRKVFVVEANRYCCEEVLLALDCPDFKACAIQV